MQNISKKTIIKIVILSSQFVLGLLGLIISFALINKFDISFNEVNFDFCTGVFLTFGLYMLSDFIIDLIFTLIRKEKEKSKGR